MSEHIDCAQAYVYADRLRKLVEEHGVPNSFAFSEFAERPQIAGRVVRQFWDTFVRSAGREDFRVKLSGGRIHVEPK